MYFLRNNHLTVSILDPIIDEARLGSRYCTGGYIWQISDAQQGDLLAGPEYPREPNTFDGQGAPDMFLHALGAEDAGIGDEVGCIGVGRVRRTSPIEPFDVRHNPEVIEFVRWDVRAEPDGIIMATGQAFHDWIYRLEREVRLRGRTVCSLTTIRSLSDAPLSVRWFAHPFFPLTPDNVLCQFSIPVSFPENPGYFINEKGFIARKPDHDWQSGCYQPLTYEKTGSSLNVVERHPKTGQVTAETNFVPDFLPIWGNQVTFSFEPYFERTLANGEEAAWQIEYHF